MQQQLYQFIGVVSSKVAGHPTAPACRLLVAYSFIWQEANFSTMPCCSLSGAWGKTQLLALWLTALESAWGPCWVASCLPEVAAVLCLGLLCRCLVTYRRGSHAVQERQNGSVQWRWQTPAGTRHCLVSTNVFCRLQYPMNKCQSPKWTSVAPTVSVYAARLGIPGSTSEA
jgi:hypothetical protein